MEVTVNTDGSGLDELQRIEQSRVPRTGYAGHDCLVSTAQRSGIPSLGPCCLLCEQPQFPE